MGDNISANVYKGSLKGFPSSIFDCIPVVRCCTSNLTYVSGCFRENIPHLVLQSAVSNSQTVLHPILCRKKPNNN